VSEIPTPEAASRPILFDREALIASLEGDERIQALREALVEAEEEWLKKAAKSMIVGTKPVDQRKIDYTRGYFAGAKHWLGGRMDVAKSRAAKAPEAEESEA
jgi:hypothetical protein